MNEPTCENLVPQPRKFSVKRCGKKAIIRYADYGAEPINRCLDCADKNVVELLITAKHARAFVNSRERIKRPEGSELYDAAIAALEPTS